MSTTASQPRTSRSPSTGHRDPDLIISQESAQLKSFSPLAPELSRLTHDHTQQFMSEVNKDLPEQSLNDLDCYSQPLFTSTLPHQFLTPEHSSENQHSDPSVPTTPSWDESWWTNETSIEHTEPVNFSGEDLSIDNRLTADHVGFSATRYQNLKDLPAELSPRCPSPHLLSPQLTTTPSSSGYLSRGLTMGPASASFSPDPQEESFFDPSQPNRLQVDPHYSTAQNDSCAGGVDASPRDIGNPAPSPRLMVSTYNRGDSPSRAGFYVARSPSKRSRTSQSSKFLAPANDDGSPSEEDEAVEHVRGRRAVPDVSRLDDGSWMPNSKTGQSGLDPIARGSDCVPALKDIEAARHLEERNAEVASWLENSEAGSEPGNLETAAQEYSSMPTQTQKPRSHSEGPHFDTLEPRLAHDSGLSNPQQMVEETNKIIDADGPDSNIIAEGQSMSPLAERDLHFDGSHGYFPPVEDGAPEQEEPLPRQFIRAYPWEDHVRGPGLQDSLKQPGTSNAAMYKFDQLAAKFETASRAATWGTRRRLSETDVQSIISGQGVRKLSLAQKTRERGSSIVKQLIPARSNSNSKKRNIYMPRDNPSADSVQKKPTDTLSGLKQLQRIPSIGKSPKSPKSPVLKTGNAFLAMTGQITAVGRSTSATPDASSLSPGPWKTFKRQRSKSEIPSTKSCGNPGLAELMTNHGGPPVPNLISPVQEKQSPEKALSEAVRDGEYDEEVGGRATAVNQDVESAKKAQLDGISPNLEGFRAYARQLNPQLQSFLTDRICQEQVRRFTKLLDQKDKHTHAVKVLRSCPSKGFCFELGGEAKDLPPRPSPKDPEATSGQFQVSGNGDSDVESNAFAEGIVTAALFPTGIPLPPVKRLPAEFECPLCFKAKKFMKPSDWTKHVHEDIQPFTCTFPNCSDSRSFKRKADWVRHENEKHRHLEWWQCNISECNHRCYRKDNFLQHLVREHKKKEPKVKPRGSTSSKARLETGAVTGSQAQQEEDNEEVGKLVEMCHFETDKAPREEVCKFCGSICHSWKKLTVHLAKHMEQIAMPVVELVRRSEVRSDTIISVRDRSGPLQAMPHQAYLTGSMEAEPPILLPPTVAGGHQSVGLQPVQSPSGYSTESHYAISVQNSPSFSQATASTHDGGMAMHSTDMAQFSQIHNLPANMSYGPYQFPREESSFVPIAASEATTYPPSFSVDRQSPHDGATHLSRSHPPFLPVSRGIYTGGLGQAPVFSSPTDAGPYPARYEPGMEPMQDYRGNTMAYDQSGMSTGMNVPQNLGYDPRQGPIFMPNESDDQSYPYPSQ